MGAAPDAKHVTGFQISFIPVDRLTPLFLEHLQYVQIQVLVRVSSSSG